jgi:hypothetical protein
MTLTARSLKLLRDSGHVAGVVERFIAQANKRVDLFGFADLLAVHRGEPGVLLVQATTRPNIGARVKKAKALATLAVWLKNGGRFEVWGWYRDAGGKWKVKRVEVRGDELRDAVLEWPRRRRKRQERDLFADLEGVP